MFLIKFGEICIHFKKSSVLSTNKNNLQDLICLINHIFYISPSRIKMLYCIVAVRP